MTYYQQQQSNRFLSRNEERSLQPHEEPSAGPYYLIDLPLPRIVVPGMGEEEEGTEKPVTTT
jgi:hypothetical protein